MARRIARSTGESLSMPVWNASHDEQSWTACSDRPIVGGVPTEECTVETLDGSHMPAVLAWPDQGAGPWPLAVVLGELFGLTDVQRDAAERVAALGHVAIAPHLLHRRAPPRPTPAGRGRRARGPPPISQ